MPVCVIVLVLVVVIVFSGGVVMENIVIFLPFMSISDTSGCGGGDG